LDGRRLLAGSAQAALATLAMSLSLALWLGSTKSLSFWVAGGGGVVVGAAVYAIAILLLRVPEGGELLNMLTRKNR
jgi:hypothetical protein